MRIPNLKSKKVLFTGVVTAVVLGGISFGADALASIPDSSGVIHGCYAPQSDGHHSPLSIIDTALSHGQCPSNQTELSWNQTGPQGPQGATGATGPQGPAGPSTAGSNGLNIETETASAQNGGFATVYCPSDHPYAIGGGGFGAPPYFAGDYPVTSNGQQGWQATAGNAEGVQVWVICSQ